ncbi:MAG: phosphoenolpyruvate--protein phosphotransferase [Spirochaetaceae bacterium]
MLELHGISASPGIAIGPAYVYLEDNPRVPKYEVALDDLASELERFRTAVRRAREELESLRDQAAGTGKGEKNTCFLDSHLMMLEDPDFHANVEQRLHDEQMNVEWILYRAIQELIDRLGSAEDDYLRERTADIRDVSKRVLNHLMNRERVSLADIDTNVILVAHDLLPSDAVAMNKRAIQGIVTDAGGKTSHSAILARSFEIPAVLGLSTISRQVEYGQTVIVDGNRGRVVVDPDEETYNEYLRVQQEWRRHAIQLMDLNELPAETRDGKLIQLMANIEVPEEVDAVLTHGTDGIGLYRSEFLFLRPRGLPSEEEQYEAYSQVLRAIEGKPVTIRTLDVGGDKVVPELGEFAERNPILGWRAIRFCLARPELFKQQLRALLRASVHGRLRIMFPMISGVEELNQALEVLDEVKAELREKGVPFDECIPVGLMIEVPSAAMTADILARRADFFSIGTNDLIQYTVAVDRGNERIAYLYEPFHPGVLRLLRMVIESAHGSGISVGMCGEMAGDPLATIVLLGLGLDEYSMSASVVPEVKRIIRSTSMVEAQEIVGTVMDMRSYDEVDRYVQNLMERRFGVSVY